MKRLTEFFRWYITNPNAPNLFRQLKLNTNFPNYYQTSLIMDAVLLLDALE